MSLNVKKILNKDYDESNIDLLTDNMIEKIFANKESIQHFKSAISLPYAEIINRVYYKGEHKSPCHTREYKIFENLLNGLYKNVLAKKEMIKKIIIFNCKYNSILN